MARLDVAAILILAVLLVAALASCFPALSPEFIADAGQWAGWEASARARYGALTDALIAGGAFSAFRSPIFLIPLALLAGATLACTLDRWPRVWRRVFHRPVLCPDAAFDAAPHTASLTAAPGRPWLPSARESLERQGFHIQVQAVGDTFHLRGDRNRLAPLATLANHLAVLLLLLGAGLSGFGWHETVTIGPGEVAPVGHATGLALRNDRFALERYADGSVAAYRADMTLIEAGREVVRQTVQVNAPLVYGELGFYLSSYGETESGYSVTLLAVYDPGYGLAIAAGFGLLLGLAVIFNFPAGRVYAQISPDGTLRLAGQAGRRAGDWFAALVKEISLAASDEEARQ